MLFTSLNLSSPTEAKTNHAINNNQPNVELVNSLSTADYIRTKNDFLKKIWYQDALASTLNLNSPTETNHITADNLSNIEHMDSLIDITWNVERRTWVKFPVEYRSKLQSFVDNNKVIKDKDVRGFTEKFIVKQMESDWWISKQNQSLFIRSAVYSWITNKKLYNWLDGDNIRLNEYSDALDYIEKCWQEYAESFDAHMKKRAEEYRQYTEKLQKIRKQLNESLGLLKDFYDSYEQSPNDILLEQYTSNAKEVINLCKKYGVNYKDVLPPQILGFYGIK